MAKAFYTSVGNEPVVLQKEALGFICNRLQMALYREVCNLVMSGVCTVEDADKAVTFGPGIRWGIMGPSLVFELGGGAGGVSGLMNHLNDSISLWLGDMADWKEFPQDWAKVAQEGVNAELANRSPETGNTHQSLEEYRDAMLIQLLKLHIVISLVAFVSGSAYGIFFAANAPNAASVTVREAVDTLTEEYRDRLEEISDTVQHDRQDIVANDDVYYIRWQDVLAVFSSYVAGSEQGAPVAALTENQVDKLREIMWAMNAVDYSTRAETAVIETTDKNGKATTTEITETVLVIELTHKAPNEMALDYHFTVRQNTYLQLLQDPQYEELWAELLGGFAQGGGELMNPDSTRTPTGTLQWPLPVAGTITSPFGHRIDPLTGEVSSHTGTDIACAEGTPILAAADGIVTVANGLDSWGGSYGYYIQIDHGTGLETLYAHCSSICVTTGQQVQAGQVIGYVGHTGRATGSHLHFEVRANGNRVNPLQNFL
ncbi:MAG: peptidoglycan DD-metalloendopeptidase family protein [Gemmiger formicilis]|uniref:peptidoglycan DD-metalloendopeptidase family protein n=1 Tax=Gemmiger formicilis TaxID=745368 RepID=UPI00266D81B3|nr:peptidoglycan DD-metalloendopeptidase family protein [uncultured Gemmiger sp.]